MKHGGDLLTYGDKYNGELIDFSSNINPLGPPEGLNKKLIESLDSLTSYPDIKYRKLKKSISKYLKCEQENILISNGAVELIDNFIITAKRVILFNPSFLEYEERAIIHHKQIHNILYKDDFTIDIKGLKDIDEGDLIILGNPNNPSGLRISENNLLEIYRIVSEAGGYLLLDEAFYEFCPSDYDSIELFRDYDYKNIGIIRAATKFFALPGIRLGYACANKEKVLEISRVQLPWRINTLADIAGQYIFENQEYIDKSKGNINVERQFIFNELSKMEGLEPCKTHTNFILIKLLNYNEEYIFNFLLEKGLLIRKCSSFKWLGDNYIRVAIKDRKNNLKLIGALKKL